LKHDNPFILISLEKYRRIIQKKLKKRIYLLI